MFMARHLSTLQRESFFPGFDCCILDRNLSKFYFTSPVYLKYVVKLINLGLLLLLPFLFSPVLFRKARQKTWHLSKYTDNLFQE